jgi:hypothetical protein
MPERNRRDQLLSALGQPAAPRHIRARPGLVDEDQPLGAQLRFARAPGMARCRYVRPFSLGDMKRRFLRVWPEPVKPAH